MHDDLIYDFGVNDGRDTEFYLLKGFRVIGIEANPRLYTMLTEKFANEIAIGRLVLLNIGVWSEPSILKFYINLDNSHWSSFEPSYGCRNGTRFECVDVQCLRASELVRCFGMPHYMKVDVEGADKHVLAELAGLTERPSHISVEEYGAVCIDDLHRLGYEDFKIVPQSQKTKLVPPIPPSEGRYVPRAFEITDTGLFGKELPGDWMHYTEARTYFTTHIRKDNFEYLGPDYEWFDVHAKMR